MLMIVLCHLEFSVGILASSYFCFKDNDIKLNEHENHSRIFRILHWIENNISSLPA